jgi:pimeloyl-ACP methyl ester carboxylesterase
MSDIVIVNNNIINGKNVCVDNAFDQESNCEAKCECESKCKGKVHFVSRTAPGSAANNYVSIAYFYAYSKSIKNANGQLKQIAIAFHGNGATKESWLGIARYMAEAGYIFLAADRRGTGGSGNPTSSNADYNMNLLMQDQIVALQDAGLNNPGSLIVLGHSFGTRQAIEWYFTQANTGNAASKLILIAPSMAQIPAGVGSAAFRAAIAAGDLYAVALSFRNFAINVDCPDCPKICPDQYQILQNETYNNALKTSIFAYNALVLVNGSAAGSPPFQGNYVPLGTVIPSMNPVGTGGGINVTHINANGYSLDQIKIPTIVINGNQDQFVVLSSAELTAALINGNPVSLTSTGSAQMVSLRGVPHFSITTNVGAVSEQILNFLANKLTPCQFNLETQVPAK